jgi:putative salt-induced outer membrane protein YdiY
MPQPRPSNGTRTNRSTRCDFLLVLAVLIGALVPSHAEESQESFKPKPPMPEKFDWVQTSSGEWVKGELIEMYKDKLEFDSDEFDVVTIDWEDVQQVRTVGTMQVGLVDGRIAVGQLFIDGGEVHVYGEDGEREFRRAEVITIVAGAPKEINYWSFKAMFGANISRGNTDVVDTTVEVRTVRRTARSRINLDFIGRYNVTEGEEVANNQRLSLNWSRFVSDKLYYSPIFFEWYHDPFQNIDHRETYGAGVGYEVVNTKTIEWNVAAGPGYQRVTYDSVEAGTENPEDTPALIAGTTFDADVTKWLEFYYEYRFQVVKEELGRYNHHMLGSIETDITSLLDFDVTLIWNRIENPRPDEEGVVPEKDDYRLTVGLTFDW